MSNYKPQDTIIAPASAAVPQAIAIIRMSGKNAFKICQKLIPKFSAKHALAQKTQIRENGKLIDDVIVICFKAPLSFTGEDTVEISCHGSTYIVSKIVSLAVERGARAAYPGEFTMRSLYNGKLNLMQAEGISDIINSQNAASHKAAADLTEGKTSDKIKSLRTKIIEILAQIEARLDDSDEELNSLTHKEIKKTLTPVVNSIENIKKTFSVGKFLKDGIKIAIAGQTNCGKSSILNALLERKRAIVSHLPGTTRDTIEEPANLHGHKFIIIDTAGIRNHSLDINEKEGMLRTEKAIEKADIVLFVSDINNENKQTNKKLKLRIFKDAQKSGKKIIEVVNKCDLLKKYPAQKKGAVYISCKNEKGIDNLKNKMITLSNINSLSSGEIVITSARHYNGLNKAYEELNKIFPLLKNKPIALELTAEHIRFALKALEEVIGIVTSEDILDSVFKNFCFGK